MNTPNHPNHLVIRALIPSIDNPDMYIVRHDGEYPLETGDITHTTEDVLRQLGRRILQPGAGVLSIEKQIDRSNRQHPTGEKNGQYNLAELLTKPVPHHALPENSNYKWARKPQSTHVDL